MQIRFIRMIDDLFRDAPHSLKTLELKEEMVQNLMEKYNDLRAEGKSEEDAFRIAAASIGDIGELIAELRKGEPAQAKPVFAAREAETPEAVAEDSVPAFKADAARESEARQNLAKTTAIGVMFIILSPTPFLFLHAKIAGLLLFAMVAAGIGLLVFAGMLRGKQPEAPGAAEGAAPADACECRKNKKQSGGFQSAFWLLVTALYFVVSFRTGAWHLTWLMFLFATSVNNLIKVYLSPRGTRISGKLSGALWTAVTGIYFIMSFSTGAWHMTWILFLVAAALQNMLKAIFKPTGGR